MNKDNQKRKIKVKTSHIQGKNFSLPWVLFVTFIAFFLSILITFVSNILLSDLPIGIAFLVLFFIICIGIFFDVLGIAVASSVESPFHAMASSKIAGARQSVWLLRNAEKVSSFCNDVIGDICGIVSGAAGAVIVASLTLKFSWDSLITTLIITAITASLTIGGKATAKTFAFKNCNSIVFFIGRILAFFSKRDK